MWQKILEFVGKQVVDATANWIELDDAVRRLGRTAGLTGQQMHSMTKAIQGDARRLGKAFGYTQQEILEVHNQLLQLGNAAKIYSQQTREMTLHANRMFGASNVTNFAEQMQSIGASTKTANTWLGQASVHSKSLGLNQSKFAAELAKAVPLMQKVNFRSGVNGLEKMVGLAQRLGVSVSTLTKAIDIDNGKFSTIEGSIEAAANLQRLGGSFGANFSNPMEVMAEGMFDAEGFADRLVRTIGGKGTFNRATGTVDMGWFDKKSLGEAAKALGMTAEELRTMANRQAMGSAIESDLRSKNTHFGSFQQSDIDAIKNLAEFNAQSGNFEVTWQDTHGNEHTEDIANLTQEQLKEIIPLKEAEKNVDKNVNTIAGRVTLIADMMAGTAKDTASTKEVIAGTKSATQATIDDYLGLDKTVNGIKGWWQDFSITDSLKSAWNWITGHENGGIIQSSPTGLEGVQKFDSGGVVGGSSYSGDRVLSRVNSGEMVLNSSQQKQLFEMANGRYHNNATIGNYGAQAAIINGAGKAMQYIGSGKLAKDYKELATSFKEGIKSSKNIVTSFKAAHTKELKALNTLRKNPFSNSSLGARFAQSKLAQHGYGDVAKVWRGISSVNDWVHAAPGKALNWAKNTKVAQGIGRGASAVAKYGRNAAAGVMMTAQTIATSKVVTKTASAIKTATAPLVKAANAFGKGVSTFGRATVQMGKLTTKAATYVGKGAVSLAGKGAKGALKLGGKAFAKADKMALRAFGKIGGKGAMKLASKAGPLGSAIAVGMAAGDAIKAVSNYSDIKKDIESRDDLSNKEKKAMIRQAQDDRNEKVGGAVGSVAGMAIGTALGGPIGAAIGSWVGEKVGGFVGKNINKAKDFLFGTENELDEEGQAQQDYEETKMGQVDIEDPQLMEKAAMATVAMHDLLISIWHHMNGKLSDGQEKGKDGFFTKVGKGIKGAVGAVTSFALAPFKLGAKAVGSLFGSKKKKEGEEVEGEESFETQILKEVTLIRKKIGGSGGFNNPITSAITSGIGAVALGPLGFLAKKLIKSKPLGEDAVEVADKNAEGGSEDTTDDSAKTINLNISGTLKLEGLGESAEIDMKKLMDKPEFKEKILDMVYKGLAERGGSGRMNKNTVYAQTGGAFNKAY